MKKLFLTIGFALFVVNIFAQLQPIELSGVKLDSVQINGGVWITGVSGDGTLGDSSISEFVTEAAVKRYADSVAAVGALDSIAAHTDTLQSHNTRININYVLIQSKQDSISMHMDSIKAHNNRIIENYSLINSKQDSIDAHTDTLQSHNTRIITNYNLIQSKQDSIDVHTDTLQSHNTRLKVLETSGVSGTSTVCIQYVCTTDTTSTSPNNTGYFIGVYEVMNGYNLVQVEAQYANSQGDMTLSANVWRNRSGTEVAMTTSGASFLTDAAIDPNNDDVATGDRLEIRWTYTGGTTAADGFMIFLTFQLP